MDRKPLVFLTLAVVAGLSFTTLEGCDLQEVVRIDPPKPVEDVLGLEGRQSLADAGVIWERWEDFVRVTTAELESTISRGQERYDVIRGLFSTSLEALGEHSSAFPGGLLITSALSGLGGLFLNKPGAKVREYKARADGFRKGVEEERRTHATS